jgi:hypothetical protein
MSHKPRGEQADCIKEGNFTLSSVKNGYAVDVESHFGLDVVLRLQGFGALATGTLQIRFWIPSKCEA